ncbi:MAG: uroporphyrinogen-III synthase [Terriglobia bacterium]
MNPENPRVTFDGLGVAAFESRHAAEMATLIARYGGTARVAPSMQEVPLEEHTAALEFGEKLVAGEFDAVIFMTGVGAHMLIQVLETRHSRDEIVRALSSTLVVARGPKALRALQDLGVPIAITLPDPHTWQIILRVFDEHPGGFALEGRGIAVQEYGASNQDLLDELGKRGAHVFRVPIYRWALPENVGPLREVAQAIIDGHASIALFTNAVQVDHLIRLAGQAGVEENLRNALRRSVVCSVGPMCSEALKNHGIEVDLEPEQHKMGALVYEAARRAPGMLKEKGREEG